VRKVDPVNAGAPQVQSRNIAASPDLQEESYVRTIPAVMLAGAVSSAMFVDGSVKPSIARLGKIALAAFSVLFALSEILSLLT
jgi:hypothetical protein